MITKTALASNFNFKRSYPEYYEDDEDRPMSIQQKRTLTELIYSRVANQEEVERRLQEMESYNYNDCRDAIEDYICSPWK